MDKISDETFLAWIRAEFEWSQSSAYRFMDVTRAFPNLGRHEGAELIDVSALYLLARPSTPEPVREAALERAAAGERVSHAAVKDQLADLQRQLGQAFPDADDRRVSR